ncbi:amidohydrolase family protein [Skermania sp. ID1734]|uniref:amidohydrolase family protein n=1 Tax=Skermania sp. ID1734 TaxID=2597516 RepID=UPI00117EAD54|nr:amidohydrolase family protein [Skermania sp. ID1734]TSD94414.1 amidohydrolase family protein [Skermania sp. ID1734]
MFDALVHIIDPRFELVENEGFLPDYFTIADCRARMAGFHVTGGAVVAGSYQGTNPACIAAALDELGPGWVGVAQLDPDASDDDIAEMDRMGVRAVRFNLKRGASDIALLTHQALRANEIAGWHAELYVDGSMLASLEPVLAKLPAVSIDHLGLSSEAVPYLLDLVDRGARVKTTGFGRLDPEFDVVDTMRRLYAVNPEALMFGSDLPGTRAERPFEPGDIDLIAGAVGDDLPLVLESNARSYYRVAAPAPQPKL